MNNSKIIGLVKRTTNRAQWAHSVYKTRKREEHFAKKYTSLHFDPQVRQRIIEYYKPYQAINPIYHEFYTEKSGVFDVRYIPNDLYYSHINSFFNNPTMAKVLDNKCFYTRIFGNHCQYPRTLAYRMNHFWYDESMSILRESDVLKRVDKAKEIVVKQATDSCGGHGVFFLNNDGDIINQFRKACNSLSGDIVVQYPLRQHEKLSALHPQSVNTIRVMSLLRKEDVKVCSAVLRIGVGDARVDNASSGGIVCGIQEDGRLRDRAYLPNGKMFLTHPTNGEPFSNHSIPSFEEIKSLIRDLHPMLPHFRLVSWDFSVDEEGNPVLIEVNLSYGQLGFHQLCNGPLFGDDTESVLNEVFGRKQYNQ